MIALLLKYDKQQRGGNDGLFKFQDTFNTVEIILFFPFLPFICYEIQDITGLKLGSELCEGSEQTDGMSQE